MLPPAVARSSFQDAFAVDKDNNKVRWSAAALDSLYDVDLIMKSWDKSELHVRRTPSNYELPDLLDPGKAYPRSEE